MGTINMLMLTELDSRFGRLGIFFRKGRFGRGMGMVCIFGLGVMGTLWGGILGGRLCCRGRSVVQQLSLLYKTDTQPN